MQVTLENLTGLERKLDIALPFELIDKEIQAQLQKIALKAKIPGFRPGKVPFAIIQKKFGDAARADAIEKIIRETYPEAVKQQNLTPVSLPKVTTVNDKPGESFSYSAVFEVYPEIKLGDLSTLTVEKKVSEVTGEDVDNMVQKLREQHVTWKEITDSQRKAQKGDQLTIDFTIKVHTTDHPPEPKTEKDVKFVLGSGYMWADFEKELYGITAGEEKKFTLKFPLTHMDKGLTGKISDFEVKVLKVCEPILPALDDAFAEKLQIKEGLVGLKKEVQENMQRELQQVLKNILKSNIMEKLVDTHPIEIPKVLLDNEVEQLKQRWQQRFAQQHNTTVAVPEQLQKEFAEQAKRNVALGLLLATVIKENQIKVEPQELRAKVEEVTAIYEDHAKAVNWYYSNRDRLLEVESMLLEDKALDFLQGKVKVVEKPISYQDAVGKK